MSAFAAFHSDKALGFLILRVIHRREKPWDRKIEGRAKKFVLTYNGKMRGPPKAIIIIEPGISVRFCRLKVVFQPDGAQANTSLNGFCTVSGVESRAGF
jgi:hypothetical protein